MNPRLRRSILVLLPLLAAIGVIAAVHGLRWRAEVVLLKGLGRLPDITWSELFAMLRPHGGVYLAPLTETPNPDLVITNPRADSADAAIGARLFATHCASCHGDGGAGGTAPELRRGAFAHGGSDWALYRAIRHGIRGTTMPPHDWPAQEIWQVVAYLRSLDRSRIAFG